MKRLLRQLLTLLLIMVVTDRAMLLIRRNNWRTKPNTRFMIYMLLRKLRTKRRMPLV